MEEVCELLKGTSNVITSFKVGDKQWNCNIEYALCKPLVCLGLDDNVFLSYFKEVKAYDISKCMPDTLFVPMVQGYDDIKGMSYDGPHWSAEEFNPTYKAVPIEVEVYEIMWDYDSDEEKEEVEKLPDHMTIKCDCTFDPSVVTDGNDQWGWDVWDIRDAVEEQTGHSMESFVTQVLTPRPTPTAPIYDSVPKWAVGKLSLWENGTWDCKQYTDEAVVNDAGYVVLSDGLIDSLREKAHHMQDEGDKRDLNDILVELAEPTYERMCSYLNKSVPKYRMKYIHVRPDGSLGEMNMSCISYLREDSDDLLWELSEFMMDNTEHLRDELAEDVDDTYEAGVSFPEKVDTPTY